MLAVYFLLPLLVFGGIVWGVVALVRRPAGEPFTLVTGVSAYAHLFVIVGALMLVTGVATSIKAGLGYADLQYAYRTPPPSDRFGPNPAERRHARADDLVQGMTLTLLGGAVLAAHLLVAQNARRHRGGAPAWIVRGTPLALTLLTAVGGLAATAAGLHLLLSYALLAPPAGRGPDPFGEQIGYALAFLPVWAVSLRWLLQGIRGGDSSAGTALPPATGEPRQRTGEARATLGPIY